MLLALDLQADVHAVVQVHTGLQFNVKRWVLVLDAFFRESAQQNSWPLGTRC